MNEESSIFTAVSQKSVVDAVREQLISLIRDGKLKPGERLPSEKHLQRTLNVSRPALREAIHTLVGEGLLEVRRGQGTFVREPSSSDAIQGEVLALLLLPEELNTIQGARRMIEPEIAARVALTASDAELDEIESLLDRMEQTARAGESIFESAWEFHRMLAKASGNSAVAKIVDILYEAIRVAERPLYDQHFDPIADINSHRELLTIIRRRDAEGARRAMIHHLGEVDEGLGEAIQSGQSTSNQNERLNR